MQPKKWGFIANNFYFVFSCLCVSFDLLWNRINFTSMRAFHFLFFFFFKKIQPTTTKLLIQNSIDQFINYFLTFCLRMFQFTYTLNSTISTPMIRYLRYSLPWESLHCFLDGDGWPLALVLSILSTFVQYFLHFQIKRF